MSIADNLNQVQDDIASACAKANRNVDDVTLVAVSKRKPVADILEAIEAGQQHFGENRVEESMEKIPQINAQLTKPVTWHMVGHIQSRKAKNIVLLFDMIQSLDSVKLARKLSKLGAEHNLTINILLEVNVSGEEAKYGFNGYNWRSDTQVKDRLWKEFHDMVGLSNINICGLMTMAPFVDDMDTIRPVFAELFALREELSTSFGLSMPDLSMGMTNDYKVAIEEGATIIRVGRAIFGERQYTG
jgi:PLP dependent protein